MPLRLILGPHRVYEFGASAPDEDTTTPDDQLPETPPRAPLVLGGLTLLGLGLWAMSRDTVKEEDDG